MDKTLEIQTTEKDKLAFDLIKGEFTADEAKDILMHMVQKKIDFHEMKIFSEDVRFGIKDNFSLERVEELRVSKNKVKEIIEDAQAKGQKVRIKSNIQIEII